MTVYGYVRIPENSEYDSSQENILKEFGCNEIICEESSNIADNKKIVDLINHQLKTDDTVVILDFNSFGKSALQSILLIKRIKDVGGNLVIMNLGVDTRIATGKSVFSTIVALANIELEQSKMLQRQGIEKAKKNGVKLGKPRNWEESQMSSAILQYKNTNKTLQEICDSTNVSQASLYRELNKLGISKRERNGNMSTRLTLQEYMEKHFPKILDELIVKNRLSDVFENDANNTVLNKAESIRKVIAQLGDNSLLESELNRLYEQVTKPKVRVEHQVIIMEDNEEKEEIDQLFAFITSVAEKKDTL